MYRRVRRVFFAAAFASLPMFASAQGIWQPTPAPMVTAENEPWYVAGSPIEWNGDFYYPIGSAQQFDRYAMVRAGSYRGIPLYTGTTLESDSIVYVPISAERVQPYARPRPGMPTGTSALSLVPGGFIAQSSAPPTIARPYDLAPSNEAAGTSGRSTSTTNPAASTAIPPKGVNNAWIEYDGRRWVAAGKATPRTSDFRQVGSYRGFPVYERAADHSTIYVPSTAELVVPYTSSRTASTTPKLP